MRRFVVALMLLALRARASTPEADFWSWFTAYKDVLARAQWAGDRTVDPLAEHLHAIDPSLTFELGLARKNGAPFELVVSADGIRSAFPAVQRLVAAAPRIPGWKVTAFRPRTPGVNVALGGLGRHNNGGVHLSPQSLRFVSTPKGDGRVDIVVFVTGASSKEVKHAVYLLLDAVLGELDVETRVAGIDIVEDTRAPASARPLAELAPIVDALKR